MCSGFERDPPVHWGSELAFQINTKCRCYESHQGLTMELGMSLSADYAVFFNIAQKGVVGVKAMLKNIQIS